MINNIILELVTTTEELIDSIHLDIVDVRKANHENLLERNDKKLILMETLASSKRLLNERLAQSYQEGNDISIYKDSVDGLEDKLKELYLLNGKLATIVLPVKEMYSEIIEDITRQNGGSLIEVMA